MIVLPSIRQVLVSLTAGGYCADLSTQLSILNAASIFGRVLPNFVADKIGPYNMIIPFSFATGIMIFGWLGVTTPAGLVVFAILYGFFSGAYISLLPSILMVSYYSYLEATLLTC